MSDSIVTITVRGQSETRLAPERGIANVAVSLDGPERDMVLSQVGQAAESIRGELTVLKQTGRLEDWSSERMTVWSDRPWNNEGLQLDPVHHASVDFTATFADFSELSDWLGGIMAQPGVQVGHIAWELTAETRVRVERETATSAIDVAATRAAAYAAALGLSVVTPLEVADWGLLSEGRPQPFGTPGMMRTASVKMAGGPEFQPGQVVVSAAVEARFAAS